MVRIKKVSWTGSEAVLTIIGMYVICYRSFITEIQLDGSDIQPFQAVGLFQ
jgi:hypothetical protein